MSSQLSSNDQSGAAAATAAGGFDWRAQISEHPLAFSAGALAAGILVGYGLAGAFGEEDAGSQGGLTASAAAEHTSYVSGKQDWGLAEGAGKPGLIEKFKNTQAFDRLQEELSSLGDRLLNELSRAGREVVLPALTGKIKELLGADVAGGSQEGGTTDTAQSASAPQP
ncbi:MAG TPA: hypothetical protein VF544_10340 [Pyrinomonadaceae bacterium]|jgi:hypothetical protein